MQPMAMSDIRMPDGDTYILVIDTDAYSGNFERELGGYVAGAFDGRGHGQKEAANFKSAVVLAGSITKKLREVNHLEYGDLTVTIRATPGRRNNGTGQCFDEDSKRLPKRSYPAYESVAIFLREPLTEEELDVVKRRAHEYAADPQTVTGRFGNKPFKILDVYQVKHTQVTTAQEERI